MRLFDEFERTGSRPASDTESAFSAFNRLAWRNVGAIRQVLDGWFSSYPQAHQRALRSLFRGTDAGFQGAFFELAVYRMLVQLGYEVQVNPQTHFGRTPDFSAEAEDGLFILEATVVEPDTFQDSLREKLVFNELNRLRCPDFWLMAGSVRGTLTSNPPLKKIRQEAQDWLDGLDWHRVRDSHSTPGEQWSFKLTHEDWALELSVIPRSEGARGEPAGRLLSGPWRWAMVDSSKSIVRAVQEKARRYRQVDAPLVVAVNCLDRGGVARIDELLALFGSEASTGEPDTARIPSHPVNSRSRIWDETTNTKVSAVLFFNEFQPSSMATARICLYENPWAAHPVPLSLRRLPHAIVTGHLVRWHDGEGLHSILDLPLDWPGPK